MKLTQIVVVILLALVATACTSSVNRGQVGATLQPGTDLKEITLEISTPA